MDLRNHLREKFPTLESERLLLRKIGAEDSDALFGCVTDPLVRRQTSFQRGTLMFPARLFRYFDDTYQSLRDLHFAIERKEKGGLIGVCSLQFWAPEAGKARLGYLLAPDFWNRGLATEAAKSLLKFGFETLRLNRIEARCSVDNPASEQVLRKCGFSLIEDGEATSINAYPGNGSGEPLKCYNLTRPEPAEEQKRICYTNEIYL
ncbi:GNAT family N-acetyltransferase [Paenibacillus sp. Marseille-P2973]|uniref:GNAT family N-acetyltransferase n=1 Tax=Paenibacillus TaxID=44249 RepID=UPI001B358277|nr:MULTISPECIES: GNAT family N-acetyltransferase [Paenibacillus]MBQ4900677.1 GNAT family N-acetyltransferase [Paenibacillus sp. Marseille-P2973]MDN4067918.1 GNAT family N-acetyltransferase [Paenibacillus vini]